ncbi:MAG: hypothetical protein ACREAZ_10750 [Nitrososphaera sp.]
MGLLTWILIAVVVLAAIGLGVGTFFAGVWTGAEKVSENPAVENATEEAKEFVSNATENSNDLVDEALRK